MPLFRKILVPIDFSACSTAALDTAAELSKECDAQLDVLHVLELPHYVVPDVMVAVPGAGKQTLTEFARREASKELRQALERLETAGFMVNSRVRSGYPRDEILAVAEEGGYDLIVMGTHGRKGLSHLFLGSVAEQVVRRACCPVLTIRTKSKD
ncbi:MAG: universal stress protein [Deltaproteobacteria bacterium]|nr:universal stress protein [Deltaproteobacteria bacterium]